MSKILIIDGYSIINRAFYGLPELTNSDGVHTNAVLGFLNIMFKIVDEENPENICVAFDVKQPTFRHLKFKEYKGTRKPMPGELLEQVPIVKDILHSMNITTIEKGGYEADDIIGTISQMAEKKGFDVVVLSGDRDLLQLAREKVLIKIPKTKQTGTIVENYYAKDVLDTYGVSPIQFIDMKGLMGDKSDNIPGVEGIGEKTAGKIIAQYGSIENALEHIEEIKPPKAQKNLKEFADLALLSKDLATIKLDCDLDFSLPDTKVSDLFNEKSYKLFKKYELKSLYKRFDLVEEEVEINPYISLIENKSECDSVFARIIKEKLAGVSVISENCNFMGISFGFQNGDVSIMRDGGSINQDYVDSKVRELLSMDVTLIFDDLKAALPFIQLNENDKNVIDISVAAYLLNPMKDAYGYDDLAHDFMCAEISSEKELVGKEDLNIFTFVADNFQKVFAYRALLPVISYNSIIKKLGEKGMLDLFYDIAMPTIYTLYDMETRGIMVDKQALDSYSQNLQIRINELHNSIISYAGEDFNINSPKQLGEILFVKMELPGAKKTKTGFSTSVDVLEKIKNTHPIISDILEYRTLTKLNSTYAVGLTSYIGEDERIHGKFNQTITATGRISSTDPNLQNIPMKMELGRLIRKAFIPKEGFVFVDADYSQIELRVLAHLSGDKVMQNAFLNNVDIHATTASEVFDVPIDQVTSLQRRNAKAVNFGIVYGISAFGLSEDLGISRKEAASYIDKYFNTYKNIKLYLDNQVEEAKEKGYVTTMFGRIRPVPELKSSNFMQRNFGERIAMNSPIQGTAADIIKIAMVKVNMELKKRNLKSKLILQIHDELLIETAADEIDIVREIVTEKMMAAAKLSIPLSIGIEQGSNWYEAK